MSLDTIRRASRSNSPSPCSSGVHAPAQKTARAIPIRLAAASAGGAVPITVKCKPSPAAESAPAGAILVASADHDLKVGLRLGLAEDMFTVVTAESVREAMALANQSEITAGWVDLDLSGYAGWDMAEWLLSQKPAVRILMLTACRERHEISAAIQAGLVFEKAAGAAGLLRATMAILAEPKPQAEARFALLQAWLRRAMPYRWDASSIPSYQHWGINE